MSSKAQNYAVGIGSGLAGGAATGASIGGPWGALIGGVIGAGAGAVGAGIKNGQQAKEERLMREAEQRQRKDVLLSLLRNEAAKFGAPTAYLDTLMEENGLDVQDQANQRVFDAQHQLDPNAFVGMAQNGALAANGIYKGLQSGQQNGPSGGDPIDFAQLAPHVDTEGYNYSQGRPSLLSESEQPPPADFQLQPYNPARYLKQRY